MCALLSRVRIRTSVATKPSRAITAPPRNALWNPSLSALGSVELPVAITSSVRDVAIVESTASPSAPPICCEVLISPLARPCSRSSTPETAAIVEVTKPNPSPIAASSEAPRMSVRKPPPTETWLNQRRPAATNSIPAARIGLKPNRVTSCPPRPAATMIVTASGR